MNNKFGIMSRLTFILKILILIKQLGLQLLTNHIDFDRRRIKDVKHIIQIIARDGGERDLIISFSKKLKFRFKHYFYQYIFYFSLF